MSFLDRILGKRLASSQGEEEKIGVWAGIPILGLDGLSSAAYGPEAALTVLAPLGVAGLASIGPITLVIVGLLGVLYLSYRQTIGAYPGGGGSYTVARENLGAGAGLLAAAALMIDYILNVAVGISAGIGALVSAVPSLQPHILALCLATLALVTLINLRGLRESGLAFGLPTYAFVGSLALLLVVGLVKALAQGGHPLPVAPLPPAVSGGGAGAAVSLWLLLRAFASGCTAMTGVEAVSNGVSAFKEPGVRNAQRTLTAIVGILAVLLIGISYLAKAYGITAMDQEKAGYQSVISLLASAVVGRGVIYHFTLASVLAVLAFSANTSFADFPRLCRLIAEDGYLPHSFATVGRRLVYSGGILVLAVLSGLLLILFGGITDRLIPLFAMGAFSAFTLSQAGMVMHWRRTGGRRAAPALAVNAFGAVATAIALAVILVAKFTEGAWVTVLMVPLLLSVFGSVHRHYRRVARRIACARPIDLAGLDPPLVVVPIGGWTMPAERALRFGLRLSTDVVAVHVCFNDDQDRRMREDWQRDVDEPIRRTGRQPPRLVTIGSPYRRLFTPILDCVAQLRREHPNRSLAVIIPELVERRWHEVLLHNHRATVLKALLLFQGDQQIVVINVPYYLD